MACTFDVRRTTLAGMTESSNVVRLRKSGDGRRRFSVATILALSFGALVLVSVGSVLALTVGANYRNTFDLVGSRATLLIEGMDKFAPRPHGPCGRCRARALPRCMRPAASRSMMPAP